MAVTINASTSSGVITTADNSGALQLQTNNGQTAMTIDTSQNVGIGTASPGTRTLAVVSATDKPTVGVFSGASYGVRIGTIAAIGGVIEGVDTTGVLSYQPLLVGGSQVQFTASGTERMRIASNGRVAIGTSTEDSASQLRVLNALGGATGNPWEQSTLTLTSDAAMAQGVGAVISLEGNFITGTGSNANFAWIKAAKTNGTSGSANGDLILGCRGGNIRFTNDTTNSGLATEKMRIDSSGNVLIGTTTAISTTNTTFGLTAYGQGTIAQYTSADTNSWGRSNNGNVHIFRQGTTTVGNINITASATAYVTSSDYRLKDNIVPMTGALDKVAQLNPVTYKWKVDGSDGQGFIAHELQEHFPDAVSGEKDAVDEDGTIKAQGVDTSFLVATLTAAIQEQQTIITELKSRIEALEGAK